MAGRPIHLTDNHILTRLGLVLLLVWLMGTPALAQEEAGAGDAPLEQTTSSEPEDAVADQPAARPADRPLNTYERFSYESGISNQLQSLMSRYIDPSLFHISVQIEGRMLGAGTINAGGRVSGGSKMEVKGRQLDKLEEDKVLEMLPALPFFSSRLRTPVKVEATETPDDSPSGSGVVPVQREGGPSIDRIRVFFVIDTTINEGSGEFYKGLITSALRMDASRGDEIVISNAAFPARKQSPSSNPAVVVQAQLQSNPGQENAMMGVVSEVGNELAWLIGVGLGLLGIFVFIGLIWRNRRPADLSVNRGDARTIANDGMTGGGGEQAVYNNQPGRVQFQTDFVMHNDPQQADLKASDPLLNWLINERETLAFAFERWIRDQGAKGIQKLVMLLHPYGNNFFDMISELLEPETVRQVNEAWPSWNEDTVDYGTRQRAMDELTLAMKNQQQFGLFPFIIYLKDKEIVELLRDEEPLQCLMVLDGLAATRKSILMGMFGTEKTAQILSAYPELSNQRYQSYAELSTTLSAKLKVMREKSERNEKAYETVLATIEQQSMSQQSEMIDNLRESNPDMYSYLRERITLWSDVVNISAEILRDAVSNLDSDGLAALLTDEEALQNRILPLRPAREQVLIKDLIGQGKASPDKIEQERRKLLTQIRKIVAATPELAKTA